MQIEHHFRVEDAKLYGVECAVILYNIRYWCDKNQSNDKNLFDDYYWTYNSTKAFTTLFPYLTQDQIKDRLKKLKAAGAILTGEYNNNKYDRTIWYSTPLHCVKRPNGLGETTQPIPDNNTNNKTHIEYIATEVAKKMVSQKTEIPEEGSVGVEVGKVIKAMESLDIKNKSYYNNKTQRAACEFLLKEKGMEKITNIINFISEHRYTIQYFPTITTPVELKDKWEKVRAAVERDRLSKTPKQREMWQLEEWEKNNVQNRIDLGVKEEDILLEFNLKHL